MFFLSWLFIFFLLLFFFVHVGAVMERSGFQVCEPCDIYWLRFRNSYPGVEGEVRGKRRKRREMRK